MKKLVKPWPHDNDYLITNYGEVFSVKRGGLKELCLTQQKTGYMVVNLKGKIKYVHRLVAETFLSNWDPGLEVNHKNLMRFDNCLDNLEMVTPSQNQFHANRSGKKGMFLMTPIFDITDECYNEIEYLDELWEEFEIAQNKI